MSRKCTSDTIHDCCRHTLRFTTWNSSLRDGRSDKQIAELATIWIRK